MNLDGRWKVRAISGPRKFMWAMKLLRDVKIISGNAGYNKAWGIVWGSFKVKREGAAITFDYFKGGIVDKVKFTSNERLFGGFYYDGKYIGNFEMKRIK